MNHPNMEYLSERDIEAVHKESLRILREVGVKVPNKTLLDAFKKHGASVDFEREVVRLPDKLVMEAVQKQVRNNAKHYGQEVNARQSPHSHVDEHGEPEVFDRPGHEREEDRTLKDLVQSIVVASSLENLEKISCFGIPAEYHGEDFINILRYYLLAVYSKKRAFLTPIESVGVARCMLDMASACADDEAHVRDGSLIYFELEPIRNLELPPRELDILVEFTRRNVTVFTTHWAWLGYHTPLTYAALLSLANANILAGIAATHQVLNPDNQYLDYLFPMHVVNKKSMSWALFGSPNQVVISFMAR